MWKSAEAYLADRFIELRVNDLPPFSAGLAGSPQLRGSEKFGRESLTWLSFILFVLLVCCSRVVFPLFRSCGLLGLFQSCFQVGQTSNLHKGVPFLIVADRATPQVRSPSGLWDLRSNWQRE